MVDVMNEQEILNKLIDIVVESIDDETIREKINPDTNIFTDLAISSISILYVAMGIEDEFNVKLTNDDVKKYQLVKEWVSYIKSKIN